MRSGISFPRRQRDIRFTDANHNGLDRGSQSMVMLQVQGGKFVTVK